MKRLLLAVRRHWRRLSRHSALAVRHAAAALPAAAARAPAYVPFFTWNGVYVGINAGYGFGSRTGPTPSPAVSTGDFNINGALVGGTLGYNMQFGASCSASRPTSTGATSRARPRRPAAALRDLEQLARHRPRPHRLCLRPLPALSHRRRWPTATSRARRRASQLQQHQCRLDRRRRRRIRLHRATGRPRSNISMSISARRPATRPVRAASVRREFKTSLVRGGVNYKFF